MDETFKLYMRHDKYRRLLHVDHSARSREDFYNLRRDNAEAPESFTEEYIASSPYPQWIGLSSYMKNLKAVTEAMSIKKQLNTGLIDFFQLLIYIKKVDRPTAMAFYISCLMGVYKMLENTNDTEFNPEIIRGYVSNYFSDLGVYDIKSECWAKREADIRKSKLPFPANLSKKLFEHAKAAFESKSKAKAKAESKAGAKSRPLKEYKKSVKILNFLFKSRDSGESEEGFSKRQVVGRTFILVATQTLLRSSVIRQVYCKMLDWLKEIQHNLKISEPQLFSEKKGTIDPEEMEF